MNLDSEFYWWAGESNPWKKSAVDSMDNGEMFWNCVQKPSSACRMLDWQIFTEYDIFKLLTKLFG